MSEWLFSVFALSVYGAVSEIWLMLRKSYLTWPLQLHTNNIRQLCIEIMMA